MFLKGWFEAGGKGHRSLFPRQQSGPDPGGPLDVQKEDLEGAGTVQALSVDDRDGIWKWLHLGLEWK